MSGKSKAAEKGDALAKEVCRLARTLGLQAVEQYRVGRRLWGAGRQIDVILKSRKAGKTLGIECKFQEKRGTVEEKILATIEDIKAWPMDGIVVFKGEGFAEKFKSYLISTGKAVELADLEPWLRLYFGLPLN
jgi:hypothetical protein